MFLHDEFASNAEDCGMDLNYELAAALRVARGGNEPPIAQFEVLGIADDHEAAQLLLGMFADHIGEVESMLFAAVSVGVSIGVALKDGRRVVGKVAKQSVPVASLHAAQEAQTLACAAGLSAPRPLVTPFLCGRGHGVIDEFLADGDQRDVRPPERRILMARDLARLVEALHPLRQHPGFGRPDRRLLVEQGSPFPIPHSRVFDFDATSAGAEWIDAVGWEALSRLGESTPGQSTPGQSTAGELTAGQSTPGESTPSGLLQNQSALVHTDWRIENLRMNEHGVSAIYDWDSLMAGDEAAHIGGVARAFSTHWRTPDPMFPSLDDMLGFIADYERARSVAFTSDERKRCFAGLRHALAYSARCEHALGDRVTWSGGWRELLREVIRSEQFN
jgi:hypothetical protein